MAYLAPGVYLRPKRTDLPGVRIVRTDVAGFVGFTERGPLPLPPSDDPARIWRAEDLAVRLTSWDEFRAIFGGALAGAYLPYAVRGFFENGGTTCHVVRVAAVDHIDRLERPEFARFAFESTGAATGAAALAGAAIPGDRELALRTSLSLGSGWAIVEITDPANGLAERHAPLESLGNRVVLASPLEASYPVGADAVALPAGLVLEATSAGSWGNRLTLECRRLNDAPQVVSFALRVKVDPGPDREHPREEEFYRELSIDPASPAYVTRVINARSRLVRVVWPPVPKDPEAPPPAVPLDAGQFITGPMRLEGGRDGVRAVAAADFGATSGDTLRGLRTLEAIDQVSILCAPDAVLDPPLQPFVVAAPPAAPCAPPEPAAPSLPDDRTAAAGALDAEGRYLVQRALIEQCERLRDRVAILDPPQDARATAVLLQWADTLRSPFGAAYCPWIRVPDPLQPSGAFRAVPPSGHVAGVYARVDRIQGVHYPPANVTLEGVADVTDAISSVRQEELNPFGLNALRAFPGRGVRVWGGRSLAWPTDVDWRFIHVRRLLSMIEESVEDSMQWTVFESHDERLRHMLVHSLTLFLNAIWQGGGLKGAVPAEGFYVKCDDTNNPASAVAAGQLICEIGVAPAAPMEFIVFEIRQKPDGVELEER